jgi:hypothetical protein
MRSRVDTVELTPLSSTLPPTSTHGMHSQYAGTHNRSLQALSPVPSGVVVVVVIDHAAHVRNSIVNPIVNHRLTTRLTIRLSWVDYASVLSLGTNIC